MKYRVYFKLPAHAYVVVNAKGKVAATKKAQRLVEDQLNNGGDDVLDNWDIQFDDEPEHAFTIREDKP